MEEQKHRPYSFTEALDEGVDASFKKMALEIFKDGALSAKDKAIIAVACAVAVKCDYCAKVQKERALIAGAKREEILEAAAVAGMVRMGSGFQIASSLLDNAESGNECQSCE